MTFRTAFSLLGYYLTLLFFGAFGLGLSVFSLLMGWLPATAGTERFFQRLIHRNFALFLWWGSVTRLLHVRFHGVEALLRDPRGLVLAANHPGLIDVTCLLARVPEAVCIFKPAIRRNPVLGAAARRAGYLPGDGGHDLVRLAAEKVGAGAVLIIFPEGTRTPSGEAVHPLKAGFVLIARRAGVPIQLVRISGSQFVLGKGHAWWKLPSLPARVEVTIGPRLMVGPDTDPVAVSAEIEAWFRSAPPAGGTACTPAPGAFSSPNLLPTSS